MTPPRALHISASDAVAVAGLATIAAFFAVLMHGARAWPYATWMVLLLVPLLLATGVAIIVRVTRDDVVPLTRLIVVGLVVKLAASFVRYYVVFSLYGTGDAESYDKAGTEIANAFHRRETSLTDLLTLRQGTKFLDDLTGVIYAAMGSSRLGGFLVYSFIGFWGLFLFHRAALIGLPEGSQRRYALLVFFLPSLVFWPSSIGKEAVMMLSLGLCAWGAARILERGGGWGWVVLTAGLGIGYMVRPHVPVVVLAALAVAILLRRRRGRPAVFGPVGRIVTVILLMAAVAFVLGQTVDRFLPQGETASPVGEVGKLLDKAASGTGEGGSEIDRPSPNSPLEYPYAAFTVLFRPTILDARTGRTAVAAAETTLVLVLGVVSWKRLRNVPSIALRRPYVAFAIVYTGIFTFAWSSFANLGAGAAALTGVAVRVAAPRRARRGDLAGAPGADVGGPRDGLAASRGRPESPHRRAVSWRRATVTSADAPGLADVLVVVSSTDRRGAEIEGVSLATELSTRGLPTAVVALAAGSTSSPLEVDVLGATPLGPSTLRQLRGRSRTAGAVVAYGSKTLPACAIALAGSDVPFAYRSIGDPAAWAGGRIRRARTAALLRRAHHVVALSERAAGTVHGLYRIDRAAISVMPNARDAARYVPVSASERQAARVALGLDPLRRVVSVVGALTPEKRVHLAVEAVARLADVALVIAGDGPGRAPLEETARRLHGTVRVVGVLPDVRPLLHASDVVLSTSSTEGMPGALIEAALCGVALVATDAGFVADVVGPGGVLVPVDAGPARVADAVRSALAECAQFGTLARRHAVAHFSWDAVAPAWLQLLATVSRRRRVVAQYGCAQ